MIGVLGVEALAADGLAILLFNQVRTMGVGLITAAEIESRRSRRRRAQGCRACGSTPCASTRSACAGRIDVAALVLPALALVIQGSLIHGRAC